ncbi:MAG: 6-carboxytetrahydropterin synthase QueD [candidate division WOR-3 bacterium]
MYLVRVSKSFSAAHRIVEQGGKCEQLHGHNYRVEVVVGSERLNPPGMVVDFNELKEAVALILPDHKLLNEVFDFNPTAENLARYFYEQLQSRFPVVRVRVWENDECWAEYEPD